MPAITKGWFNLVHSIGVVSMEAQQVIAMRLAMLSMGGPDAGREAWRMMNEKVTAFVESQQLIVMSVVSGEWDLAAERVVRLYGRVVRANHRRLSRF